MVPKTINNVTKFYCHLLFQKLPELYETTEIAKSSPSEERTIYVREANPVNTVIYLKDSNLTYTVAI